MWFAINFACYMDIMLLNVFFLEWTEKFLSGKIKFITLCILNTCSLSLVKLVLHACCYSCEYLHFPQCALGTVLNASNYIFMLRNSSYRMRNLHWVYYEGNTYLSHTTFETSLFYEVFTVNRSYLSKERKVAMEQNHLLSTQTQRHRCTHRKILKILQT